MRATSLMTSTNGRTYIDRPPRIQPEIPFAELDIPAPPDKKEDRFGRLLQIGLPLVSILGFALVATFGGLNRSPLLILPMALAALASTGYGIYSYRKEKQQRAASQQAYSDLLVDLTREMNNYHDLQRRAFHYNYPDPASTLRFVQTARAEVARQPNTLRAVARLWERRVSDRDFGVVRLGIGTLPSTVTYTLEDSETFDDPQVREAMKLDADSRFVSEIPVILSFRHPASKQQQPEGEDRKEVEEHAYQPPVTHAVGIVGERQDVYEFARALLAHYVVFHAPMDARLYVLASQREPWRWSEALPHSRGDDQSRFHCFLDGSKPAHAGADHDDGDEREQFLEGIRKVLAQRKIRLQEHEENEDPADPTLPLLLIVVDLMDAASSEDSPLHKIESDAAISILLEEGARLGAAGIFLLPERSKVPGGCSAVIEIERTAPATNSRTGPDSQLHFRYAETGLNSTRLVGAGDFVPAPAVMENLAGQLAHLGVRQGSGANLPASVPFLDLMGFKSLQELSDHSLRKWAESTEPHNANWLRVKLGLMSGNKPRTLVFSAKRDGVHGMVAGSTGSGKSELLISLIMGLAVTYDPTVINFVLVDYKGGSAFNEFRKLPHCVDVVTNLGEDSVVRMFTTIRAELNRRTRLNTSTGTRTIVEYRQRGYHLQKPYPYLFIIIDEFAEMIADRAEFKSQLETITRIGRAQGVSLILAAQRPSGVTDQMRSNIKFRICLRVETPAESREMLRRSDAAFLPSAVPGRGYLQVANEEIELVQLAFTGDRYRNPNQTSGAGVIWPRRGGRSDSGQDQEPPELYKAIIGMLEKLAEEQHTVRQLAPWPGFLPQQLSLTRVLISDDPRANAITSEEYLAAESISQIMLGQPRAASVSLNPAVNRWLTGQVGWLDHLPWRSYALRPVVGLIDDPQAAKQLPLVVDLHRGHVVVLGASGSGKTTFLRTLIASLAATHSADNFHAYILDLGGRNLGVLAALPHVGAMILPDDLGYEERTEQLLRELDAVVERRKTLLNNAQLNDIYEYNQLYPAAVQPAILVAIDNFVELAETFGGDSSENETLLDRLIALIRQARPCAMHFAISAGRPGELSNQLYSLFSERFTLKLADPTEYRIVVGEQVPDVPAIPGRGYTKIEGRPLSFQVATVAKPEQELKRLREFVENIDAYVASAGPYNKPLRVEALPKSVLFRQLLAREHGLPLDETFIERLKVITRKKWRESAAAGPRDWLKATVGVVSGDRPRLLEFEATKDGVHGMIAGATGSGKSELLMTLIVSLALNYDPSVLNLVLVDYKGGGTFKPFEKLPHCVDVITNLNKSDARRVFASIDAEMQRRQKLNADTDSKDIMEYRRKGLHLHREPYPHLLIIIDEYAEMIADSPEFREQLDSITSIGRALGVNLFLASQQPVGVSDQMRANMKLRVALRVEGVETSREMLRRPDAAFLPGGVPGRAYMQVGNEKIELMQAAYTGEEYEYADVPDGTQKPRFYDVIVNLLGDLLEGEGPSAPWPPFLPRVLTFSSPLQAGYLDPVYRSLITLDQARRLVVNPFVQDWLDGSGGWVPADWNKTAMRSIAGLIDDPFAAQQVPLLLDFTKGHVVLFGAAGWGKTTFMRSTVLSLATRHSPAEFQAHVLDLGGRNLEVLRELPHVGTVILPDEPGYQERVQQLWRELDDVLEARKKLFGAAGTSTLAQYNSVRRDQVQPAILVVIDNFSEYVDSFGDPSKQNDPDNLLEAFVSLARQGKAYGLHFVTSLNRLSAIPSKLYSLFTERLTLRLADPGEYSGVVGSQVEEIEEIAGRGYTRVGRRALAFQVALLPGAVDAQGQVAGETAIVRAIGARMREVATATRLKYTAPVRVDALPTSSSYRHVLAEMLQIDNDDETFRDQLRAAMARRWELNAAAENADWLQATLGVTSGGRKRTLHFDARRDGTHGMIAGATGSGKSELLITLIVALAVNYPPQILNFVLVDYKGGGTFRPFEKLPHCVDIVTNLNKAAVDRMFTAINAEIRRRQDLNAETRTKDIVDYRRKGLHENNPYPHLFIVIDEYAEMIDDNPEYRQTLESITRVGRAQGVNLILASQQPKGVSDQMRANIKLRVALRVEGVETSREMLRRPDAAFLPNNLPGRGYLQVGNDNLELLQVAYTGEEQPDRGRAAVLWPQRPAAAPAPSGEEPPRLFDVIVSLSSALAGGIMAPRPWPSFLPTSFSLESPLLDAQRNGTFILESSITDWFNGDTGYLWQGRSWRADALRPVVGLVDNPAEAAAFPLRLDLSRGHLGVFGDPGLGKTTLLRTLLVSLAATHSPDELHTYVLDLGGRNFLGLKDFPHMGTVIFADEDAFEERLQRLLDFLERTIEARQQLLGDAEVAGLYEFNEQHPESVLPAIVVFVDNIAKLHESHEALVDTTLIPLMRRSVGVGVSFVVSGNLPTNMPGKLYNLLAERLTFKQSGSDRYMDIVGRGAIELDDIPGRGYIRIGQKALLFQAARPWGSSGKDDRYTRPEAEGLRLIAANMRAHLAASGGPRTTPDPVSILPELVLLQDELEKVSSASLSSVQALVGQDSRLQPASFDLKRMGPHFAIVGPPLSGKTTALHSWILSLAACYSPRQVRFVLVDTLQGRLYDYGGDYTLEQLPHVLMAISDVAKLGELLLLLANEGAALSAQRQGRSLFVVVDNFDDFSEEVERNRSLAGELTGLARRYGRSGLHFVVGGVLDGPTTDLRRRVQSSNYGIGLRTAQAVEALRVQRTPAALRDREFPPGRGYVVKSGQTTMIQVATPYGRAELPLRPAGPDDEEGQRARALDRWVELLREKYSGQRAMWSDSPVEPEQSQLVASPLLRKVMAVAHSLQAGNGHDQLLAEDLRQMEQGGWENEEVRIAFLKKLWVEAKVVKGGLPRATAESLVGMFPDDESLVSQLETLVPEAGAGES